MRVCAAPGRRRGEGIRRDDVYRHQRQRRDRSAATATDTIYGLDGDDIISAATAAISCVGGAGNDQLYGENGNDHLFGGAGDDLIDGNNGFDTAYYSGLIEEYTFLASAGYLHILHQGGAGPDGHDQVIRVERLVFADRVINIGSGTNRPVAVDDHVFINEDTGTYNSGAASVLDNDFDFDGDAMTVTGGTFTGTYGTLTLNCERHLQLHPVRLGAGAGAGRERPGQLQLHRLRQ